MNLVFLLLEPAEKPADAAVVLAAVDDQSPLLVREVGPRHVETDPALARRALEIGKLRAVVRLAPRLDGALLHGFRRIGHHEIHVELDDVAEAVAGRAGAERVVERKQTWLGILVSDAARTALEALGKQYGPA